MFPCCEEVTISRLFYMLANRPKSRECAEVLPGPVVRNCEPEVHIERHGIDHYLCHVFPYDTLLQRQARKKRLLLYPCLAARETRYQTISGPLKFEI